MWVRGRPAGDGSVIEASQLREETSQTATRLIRQGSGVAISSDYAGEHHLKVGSVLSLPTPSVPRT